MTRSVAASVLIAAVLLTSCDVFKMPTSQAPFRPPTPTGEFPDLEQKALKGATQAQVDLGDKYFEGAETTQDFLRARDWYMMAALAGDAQAQLKVGLMDFHGQGGPVNLESSKEWFEKSAAQGVPRARNALGLFAYNGWVDDEDKRAAFEDFKNAGLGGYGDAMFNVGSMYARGEIVELNPVEALAWFMAAQSRGVPKAVNAVILIKAALTEEQVAVAEAQSQQILKGNKGK